MKKIITFVLTFLLIFCTAAAENKTLPDISQSPVSVSASSPEPTALPESTSSPESTALPEPTSSPEPTALPEPTSSPEPTALPESTSSPEPTVSSEPTVSPESTALPEPTISPESTSSPEPTEYAETIIDELEDFSKINSRSIGVIYDITSDVAALHGDETIMQRIDKSEQYISYEIPYWEAAEVTAYFYPNEEINHFIFKSGENIIEPKINITDSDGKWHKVVYSLENPVVTEKNLYIYWQDLSDTDFTNWGQTLGEVRIHTAYPKACTIKYLSETVFGIPDAETSECELKAEVYDQNGIPFDETLTWSCESKADGILFNPETAELKISATTADNTEINIKIHTKKLEPITVAILFKKYSPGDINGDFRIDKADLELALQNYRKSDNTRGDINGNGIIDIYDLAYIKKMRTIIDSAPQN